MKHEHARQDAGEGPVAEAVIQVGVLLQLAEGGACVAEQEDGGVVRDRVTMTVNVNVRGRDTDFKLLTRSGEQGTSDSMI